MNVQLKDITVTARDGRVSHLEQVYIRGSHVRFFIVPDMLRYATSRISTSDSSFLAQGARTNHGFYTKQECPNVQISKRSWTWCWFSKRSRNSQQGAGWWTRRRWRSWRTWLRHRRLKLEYWTLRRRDVGFCRHDENSILPTAASSKKCGGAQYCRWLGRFIAREWPSAACSMGVGALSVRSRAFARR